MKQASSVQKVFSSSLIVLITLVLSACQMGSQLRGKHHLIENKYIPLRATPYACPQCQKSLEKILTAEYEHNRAALMAEKQELGDFGPQPNFCH
jgi:hypothetical protein